MTVKEKAKELTEKFKDYVNPYIGSGMLSNSYDDSAILMQSKKCAKIAVDEIISACEYNNVECWNTDWWNKVKKEIDNL